MRDALRACRCKQPVGRARAQVTTKESNIMSNSVALLESEDVSQAPPSALLDETVWQAWVAKGRMQMHGAAPRD